MNVFRGYLILVATVNGVHEKNENEELRPHNIFTTAHTHTQPFYGSLDFVQDNSGEPVPEEKFITAQ